MRILVLTQVVIYPANSGAKMKTLQVVRHLATQHEIIYCTFARNQQEANGTSELKELCQHIVTVSIRRSHLSDAYFLLSSLLAGDSFLLRRDERKIMHTTVKRLLQEEQIDAVHVDQLNMLRFMPDDWSGKVVLDEHNAVWQVIERLTQGTHNPLKRWFLQREVRHMRRLEGLACRRADVVLTVSEQDKVALRAVAGDAATLVVVPITVDVEQFAHARLQRDPEPQRLLSIGTMFWLPNSEGIRWWLRTGYVALHRCCPQLCYDIVGARPPQQLEQLAANREGVQLHGYVADVEPFWRKATALVVPLLSGGGVRVKILEAMARGVPVVTTSLGCEGLAVQHKVHVLIADTPEEFSAACLRIMQEPELAKSLMENALEQVKDLYDAKSALDVLDIIYAPKSVGA